MSQQDPSTPDPNSKDPPSNYHKDNNTAQFERGPRFWTILCVLALVSLLTSLEATVTSTILPSVVAELDGGGEYVWIANATFLTM